MDSLACLITKNTFCTSLNVSGFPSKGKPWKVYEKSYSSVLRA